MRYVTYDQNGALTGAYIQDLHPSHSNHIEVSEAELDDWVLYQANPARNGLVLAPVVVQPIPVPQSVTMRQARLALLAAGLLDPVNIAVLAAGSAAQVEWEYASEVQRSAGLVPAMAAALGMSDAQIDALFVAAAAL